MSKDRVERAAFGSKTREIGSGWEKQCSEDVHNLCCSPDITGAMKSKRLRWAEHVAYIG